jgi:very-short-patch-repair endonuclease
MGSPNESRMPMDVSAQIQGWRQQLLDTSKRNRLISFKAGRTGGIPLVHPDSADLWQRLVADDKSVTFVRQAELIDLPEEPEEEQDDSPTLLDDTEPRPAVPAQDVLERCRRSPRLRDHHVLTDFPDKQLAARLTRLALGAGESLSEQGVSILFVAFGFLRWFESPSSKEEVRSPLLLVPVRLDRESIEAHWTLRAEDEEVLPNHALAQRLQQDFRLKLPMPGEDDDPDVPEWRTAYFGEVQRALKAYPAWDVLDEVALGTFSFQKLAMWEDLQRSQGRIQAHPLCRAIAGDGAVRPSCPSDLPEAGQLDERTQPASTYHILDADSSQHAAVVAVTKGANLVLDGPPGTGKSQTIANTIAELLAAGKTVLFVSEKTAALEVVKRRLEDRGLGDFCLELHSHKASKREVVAELGRCLALPRESHSDPGDQLRQLHETRTRLNAYVHELHARREPLGMTAYRAHGELARLERLKSSSRCTVADVHLRDAAYLRRVTEALARLPACRSAIEEGTHHPWHGCRARAYSLTLRQDAAQQLGLLAHLLGRLLEGVPVLCRLGFLSAGPTRAEWQAALVKIETLLKCPAVPSAWFTADPRRAAQAALQMDEVTRRCRQLGASLSAFNAEAVRQASSSSLADLARAAGEGKVPLPPVAGETVRQRLQRLQRVASDLEELRRQAEATEQAWQEVLRRLGAKFAPLPVRWLPRFAGMVAHMAGMKPVRRSWWDAGRRKELQEVCARCPEQTQAAHELRLDLLKRLSPRAFSEESAALTIEASGYTFILFRWLPRWRSLRRQVTAWYTTEAPSTQVLFDDLGKLVRYQRHLDYCRQAREHYAQDLLADADGQPDWEGTRAALADLDRLEQFGKVPANLQAALSGEGGLDREGLAAAGRALGQQARNLHERAGAVNPSCPLGEALDGEGQFRCNLGELTGWLLDWSERARKEMSAVGRLTDLLQPDQDLPLDQLAEKVMALAELGRLRDQLAPLQQQLHWCEGAREVEARDWSTIAERARSLLSLLNGWGRPLAQSEALALHDQAVRQSLTEEVRRAGTVRASGLEGAWQFLGTLFDPARPASEGVVIDSTPLERLRPWLAARADQAHRIEQWTQLVDVEEEVRKAGVGAVLVEVRSGQVTLEEAADAFRARFFRLWLDALYERTPALKRFTSGDHQRLIEQFRQLDRRSVEVAPLRIRQQLLSRPDRPRATAGEAPPSSELGTLQREVNKKRRHLPLRRLFARMPGLLLRLKPCLMMSPLAVSTYLESADFHFDLVIFDEASQVRPHDAVCAIYRGRQLMVAGDQKQLPPTSFFERAVDGDEEDEDGAEAEGQLRDFDSILDVCCSLGLKRSRLRWHYRSRREGLIAFANRHVYGNELVTFPSVEDTVDNPAVHFEHVAQGRWRAGASGGFNIVEAARTADLVLAHFRAHPDQSLGVIAFSQRQQRAILDALERRRRACPELEGFFREDTQAPFFVKNLENVQGDERDVIFLAVGYGPDETGRVMMRFGPLNRQGGERRLNVAVTRAKHGMTVISSMRAEDMDLSKTKARGVHLLRDFLDYAERGLDAVKATITEDGERGFDSPFEREVAEELQRQGLTVRPQVGCSSFRIDLAVVDPRAPGRYLLGVECDGATYHSSATARDRDRLRQQVLEDLKWRICRVWSTDWLRDRNGQVQRVLEALRQAQAAPVSVPAAPTAPLPPAAPASTAVEAMADEMQEAAQPTEARFASIDDVPESTLRDEILRVVVQCGATEQGDLTQSVARALGFRRTGNKIQARIEAMIASLEGDGSLTRAADGRVRKAEKLPVQQ